MSIADDDHPVVTVSFEQASYAGDEGDNVTIKVKLSADPEQTVTVPLDKTDQDGANSADYSGVPNSVTFDAGETEYEFTFSAASDNIDDDKESVKLVLGTPLPSGVTAGSPSETVVSITDDDLPSVNISFSAGSYSAEEGGTVQVTITLSQAPERQVSIPITKANQGGASNSDYSGVPITVNFAASDTEVTFTFSATDDSVDDDGESVKLGFGAMPLRVSAGTNPEATVNITDGDVPTVSVSFEQNGYSVAEGPDVDVKVQLDADPERDFTISILKLNQNGSDSSDYSGVPANVMFASGETEKSFTFTAESDDVDDDGENVRLSFGTMPAGVNAGTNANTTVSVVDDDHPADVKVSFENAAYTVAEGNSVAVKLTLNKDPERTVTVPLSKTNQGGTSNSDYSGMQTYLQFDAGDTEKTFTFRASSDNDDDDDESVRINLETLPTGLSTGVNGHTVVAITDNDDPDITVRFEQSVCTVTEGGDVSVKIILSAQPEREVTIAVTATLLDGASTSDFSEPRRRRVLPERHGEEPHLIHH